MIKFRMSPPLQKKLKSKFFKNKKKRLDDYLEVTRKKLVKEMMYSK